MEKKSIKEKIVSQLINQNINVENEQELLEMLINEPIAVDVDKLNKEKLKFGDKLADAITRLAGSWLFIVIFCLFLISWMVLNNTLFKSIDPYPYILLNLMLSCIAALQAPIIMMSQNRQAEKDSLRNQNDYRTDLKSELILESLHDQMNIILKNQKQIIKYIKEQEEEKNAEKEVK